MGCGVSTMDAEDSPHHRSSNILSRRHKMVRPVTNNNLPSNNLIDNGSSDESEDSSEKQSPKSVSSQGKDVFMVMKPLGDPELKTKQDGSEGEKTKEKWVDRAEAERAIQNKGKEFVGVEVDTEKEQGSNTEHDKKNEQDEADTNDREDAFIGGGSPSFREYCIDNDSGVPSFRETSNGYDSGESTHNEEEFCMYNACAFDASAKRKNQARKEEIAISNKEPEKKERKGRGFMNVMPKGRAGGRRNIFACYNVSAAASYSGNATRNKVAGKAA